MQDERKVKLADIIKKLDRGQKLTRLEEIFYLLNIKEIEKVPFAPKKLINK